ESCEPIAESSVLGCVPMQCDPTQPATCPAGTVCVPTNGGPNLGCVDEPPGSGPPGAACKFANSCIPGSVCAAFTECGSAMCCTEWCFDDTDCPGGLPCSPWFPGGQAPPQLEGLGACGTPEPP
ncbi:MAG: hypothetical protein AAF721_15210, partial [Myxococcota bacterium]